MFISLAESSVVWRQSSPDHTGGCSGKIVSHLVLDKSVTEREYQEER